VPDSPRFGRVEILTLFSIIEQAQESIQYKNRTLANSARMRHTSLKITRGVAFGHPNNLLALQSVAHPANHSSGILSSTVSVKRIECDPGGLVPAVQLTRKQRTLVDEIHHIFPLLGLDYFRVLAFPRKSRTVRLELAKRHAISGEVITQDTLIDERLSSVLCDCFFGRHRSYIRLWKTKKFKRFNHHVLQELSVVKKLAFVREIVDVPGTVANDIERINSLRSALAHAFFPENLKKPRLEYKTKKVFSYDGIRLVLEDCSVIYKYFDKKRYYY
jgi:hypothetical protein